MIFCSGTLGSVPIEQKARAAAAAGFSGISVYSREYFPGLERILLDLGLTVAELDGALAWLPDQPGAEVGKALDIAAALGARSLTAIELEGVVRAPAEVAAAFADLCDRAAAFGLVVHVEPFPWSGIPTLVAASEVVTAAGRPNGGILLDTWHLLRGNDRGAIPAGAVAQIVAVQVSDPAPTTNATSLREECMSDRRAPGDRSAAILSRLPRGLPVEVEVFGMAGTPEEVAAQSYRALEQVLALAGRSRGHGAIKTTR
jgi:sugar phosphate isomerase/epimerase